MLVSKNKVVEISFKLSLDGFDGEIVQEYNKEEPFKFIFGIGDLFDGFENKINGMSVGDKFKFMLPVDEAYGEIDEEAIIDFPSSMFNIDKEYVYVGSVLPFKDQEGNEIEGTIVEINENTVTVDFNHPLAGEDLYFEGKILNIREATSEELKNQFPN